MSHRHLVLGLLAEKPMTGYAIKKQVSQALKSVTHASYGTLYPTLHRLLDEGAIRLKEVPQARRPTRKVYEITADGQRELEEWLRRPARADQVRREFLLKLYLARDFSPQDLGALLRQRQTEMQTQLDELCEEQASANGDVPDNEVWVRQYAVELCRAELNWLNRLMVEIDGVTDWENKVQGA